MVSATKGRDMIAIYLLNDDSPSRTSICGNPDNIVAFIYGRGRN
jgi:hypothetical protein